MLRQAIKRISVIRRRNCSQVKIFRAISSETKGLNLEVKINSQNESFELHDTEADITTGKQKKFEFPFIYLRDNCQVSALQHHHHHESPNLISITS